MPAYNYPTTTEVTTLETSVISTSTASGTGYNFVNSEKPVPSAKLRGWLKAVKDVFVHVKADEEAFITPTLLNSWVAFGTPFTGPGYFKGKNNIVRFQGLVKSGTLSTNIFSLPVGYRPSGTLLFAVSTAVGATITFGEVRISSNGDVQLVQGGNAYVTLSNISFRV